MTAAHAVRPGLLLSALMLALYLLVGSIECADIPLIPLH